jgi:anti-anti-sigma regulatory factor
MVQVSLARGWDIEVERGPDLLFVRPRPLDTIVPGAASLAEQVWALLEQNFTHRLILELDDVGPLDSHLIGQLVWLQNRIHGHDGIMRICGLSSVNQELLRQCELEGHVPCYRDREEAVMGQPWPNRPR